MYNRNYESIHVAGQAGSSLRERPFDFYGEGRKIFLKNNQDSDKDKQNRQDDQANKKKYPGRCKKDGQENVCGTVSSMLSGLKTRSLGLNTLSTA